MSKLVIIEKASQVEELIHYCQQTKYASFDYETSGFNYYSPQETPLILGVSFQAGSSWILPLGHKDSPFLKTWKKHFKLFGEQVLQNWDIVKVAWNLKFEYKWTMAQDIMLKGRLMDAMLAKYCLDEERPHGLKPFVDAMFPQYAGYEKKLRASGDEDEVVNWRNINFLELCTYCGVDSDLTLRSMVYLEQRLIKLGFYNLFRNLLMMILRVLAESEYRGMLVDRPYIEGLVKEYATKIQETDNKLRTMPAVLKYEQKFRKHHLLQLVQAVQLEIEELKSSDKPNANRLIGTREQKIRGFYEGKFNNKEKYEGFNFNSPNQLIEFLFTSKFGLKLKPFKYTKNKDTKQRTDRPSTDEESLIALKERDKSGFMDTLMELRALVKINSTYVKGMYEIIDHNDRVHANFKINGTVTGRLSCVAPNLQNIPRGTTAADIKRMFIPPPGYLLLEVDYSQAELRVIAEVSGDKAMIDIFNRNYNIHVATACKMENALDRYDEIKKIIKIGEAMDSKDLEKPENKDYLFWVKQKKKGKSLNFSIVYQQGDDATSATLHCTKEEASKFKKEWFDAFPGVKKWIDNQKKYAHKHGYVYNLFGRKRRLYDIYSEETFKQAEAERQAVNAPIQGTSGDFALFSQVVIREHIKRGLLPIDLLHVYTVHDSIGYYIKPNLIHEVVPKLVAICDNPETQEYFHFSLKAVKMKVSAEVGKDWGDLTEYNPEEDYIKWIK